jgi:hypothetical protein
MKRRQFCGGSSVSYVAPQEEFQSPYTKRTASADCRAAMSFFSIWGQFFSILPARLSSSTL